MNAYQRIILPVALIFFFFGSVFAGFYLCSCLFVVLYVGFDCFADPSCHSNHAHTLAEHVELCVYGRQKLNPDILSLLDSWSESLSFRDLCNIVCGCCGGYSIDTGTNLSLSSTFCRIQL